MSTVEVLDWVFHVKAAKPLSGWVNPSPQQPAQKTRRQHQETSIVSLQAEHLAAGAAPLDATPSSSAITPEDVDATRQRLHCQQVFGTQRPQPMLEDSLQRRVVPAKFGSPRAPTRPASSEDAHCPVFWRPW